MTEIISSNMTYKPHGLCEFIPMASEETIDLLVASIKQFGFRENEPIILYEKMIIDGRSRYRACTMAGAEPKTVRIEDICPEMSTAKNQADRDALAVDFIITCNIGRRQMDKSQIALAAAKLSNLGRGQSKKNSAARGIVGWSQEDLAKKFGVSEKWISGAKKVLAESPEIAELVEMGKLSIKKALGDIARMQANNAIIAKAESGEPNQKNSRGNVSPTIDMIPDVEILRVSDSVAPDFDQRVAALAECVAANSIAPLAEACAQSRYMLRTLTHVRGMLHGESCKFSLAGIEKDINAIKITIQNCLEQATRSQKFRHNVYQQCRDALVQQAVTKEQQARMDEIERQFAEIQQKDTKSLENMAMDVWGVDNTTSDSIRVGELIEDLLALAGIGLDPTLLPEEETSQDEQSRVTEPRDAGMSEYDGGVF